MGWDGMGSSLFLRVEQQYIYIYIYIYCRSTYICNMYIYECEYGGKAGDDHCEIALYGLILTGACMWRRGLRGERRLLTCG